MSNETLSDRPIRSQYKQPKIWMVRKIFYFCIKSDQFSFLPSILIWINDEGKQTSYFIVLTNELSKCSIFLPHLLKICSNLRLVVVLEFIVKFIFSISVLPLPNDEIIILEFVF